MQDIDVRVASLERALRRQRLAGALGLGVMVAALLAAAAPQKPVTLPPGELEARELRIVDAEGNVLIELGGHSTGSIRINNAQGRLLAVLGGHDPTPGAAALRLLSASGDTEAILDCQATSANLLLTTGNKDRKRFAASLWTYVDEHGVGQAMNLGSTVAFMGATKDENAMGGEINLMESRPVDIPGEDAWGGRGTYFRVSPDERWDRPSEQIRRLGSR